MIHNQATLEQELGALRFSCKQRPREKESLIERIVGFVLMYFLAILIAGAILIIPLEKLNASLLVNRICILSLALVITVYVCRRIDTHKSKNYLCLFEDGFASRVAWMRRQFRFSEIEYIGFGQLLTNWEKRLQPIGYLALLAKPSAIALHDEAARNMITVILRSGQRVFVKGVLCRFDPEDTHEFFRILIEEHPELWEPPPPPAAAAE